MNTPMCPKCGETVGYGFENDKLIVDMRTKVGAVFEDGCLDVYSMEYPDFNSVVKIVDYIGDSVECLACGAEITDQSFIKYILEVGLGEEF